jgi:hypothetical protein
MFHDVQLCHSLWRQVDLFGLRLCQSSNLPVADQATRARCDWPDRHALVKWDIHIRMLPVFARADRIGRAEIRSVGEPTTAGGLRTRFSGLSGADTVI